MALSIVRLKWIVRGPLELLIALEVEQARTQRKAGLSMPYCLINLTVFFARTFLTNLFFSLLL